MTTIWGGSRPRRDPRLEMRRDEETRRDAIRDGILDEPRVVEGFNSERTILDTRAPIVSRVQVPVFVRGGVRVGALVTGALVAFGVTVLMSAIAGAIILVVDGAALGAGNTLEIGTAAAASFIAVQFLAYLWGGYTAGRMGRGAGLMNGLLVPFAALIMGGIVAAIVWALGTGASLNWPFTTMRFAIDENLAYDVGVGLGLGAMIAMFLGAMVGGMLGARWHDRLEARKLPETVAKQKH